MTDQEIQSALSGLPSWSLVGGKLHREFKFQDFVGAFGFMTKVAILAEKINHHPEWSNVYNSVVLDLSTHEVGGISALDVDLARSIDAVR